MSLYYTANIWFTVFAMFIMLFAVSINPAMDERRRRVTRLLFAVIIVSALCEWSGNLLDNAPAQWIWLHKLVKMIELSCAPYIGIICGHSLSLNSTRQEKITGLILGSNVILEVISAFTGWVWYVDAQNQYHHGVVYGIYVACYLVGIAYYLVQGMQVSHRYQQSGGVMLLLVTLFLMSGIGISLFDNSIEITWLAVGMAAMMLYKFYSDILQQVDGLTELGNRWGYEDRLQRTNGQGAVLFFDVDCFKQINDTYGHTVGDQCLCAIAQCLRSVYGTSGRIFRIGGDEFCVVLVRNMDRIEQMNRTFQQKLQTMQVSGMPMPGVSVGYAEFDTSEEELNEAVERADAEMYRVKKEKKS